MDQVVEDSRYIRANGTHIYFSLYRIMLHDHRFVHGSRAGWFRLDEVVTLPRRSPDSNGLPKPVPIIKGVDNRLVVYAERVNNTHGGQTVYANARLPVDMENFFLTVHPIGTVAGRAVVVGEEAVQACSKYEDVVRLGDLQAPRGLLSSGKAWIFPLRERSVERAGWWRSGLKVGRFGLWKPKIMVRSTCEVVVEEDVVLGSCSNEPHGTSRLR